MDYKDDQDGSGCWRSIQSMFGTKKMINHTAKIDDSMLKFEKVAKSGEEVAKLGDFSGQVRVSVLVGG